MPKGKSLLPTGAEPNGRRLKIEADGDPYKGAIKPKIRIMGRWLERAGFKPGNHVHVTCVTPGVIELCSARALPVSELTASSFDPSERSPRGAP